MKASDLHLPKTIFRVTFALFAILAMPLFAQETGKRFYGAQAVKWSKTNDGIAIAISIGTTSPYSGEELGEKISLALRDGFGTPILSAIFVQNRADEGGNAVTFAISGVARGPYSVLEVVANLPEIVGEFRALQAISN